MFLNDFAFPDKNEMDAKNFVCFSDMRTILWADWVEKLDEVTNSRKLCKYLYIHTCK